MSEPYRGFVELPRAIFEALHECAEVAVAQAAEKAKSPTQPLGVVLEYRNPPVPWFKSRPVLNAMLSALADARHLGQRPVRFLLSPAAMRGLAAEAKAAYANAPGPGAFCGVPMVEYPGGAGWTLEVDP